MNAMKRNPEKRVIKQDRALKTRHDILSSAIELFARRGILATTMSELARAIRMTPGALYWHFPTKEDLLLAAVEELNRQYLDSFQTILDPNNRGPASKQLQQFTEHTVRYIHEHREHGIFYGMLGAEAAENNGPVAAALRDALAIYVNTVDAIVRYGQKTKEFRADVDSRTIANAVIFGNIGLIVQQNLFKETLSYIPMAQANNEMIIAGLMAKKN